MSGTDPQVVLSQLVHRYASAVDRRDRDALLELFAPDAVLEFEHRTAGARVLTPAGRRSV